MKRASLHKPRGRTGPTTEAGKKRSSKNALSHGIRSDSPVIAGESREQWLAHVAGFHDSLRPRGGYEEELTLQVAWCAWRLRRVARFEQTATEIAERSAPELHRCSEMAKLAYNSKAWHTLLSEEDFENLAVIPGRVPFEKARRYESHYFRMLDRYLGLLERAQRLRRKRKTANGTKRARAEIFDA